MDSKSPIDFSFLESEFPIPIRMHHVLFAKTAHENSREECCSILRESGYIRNDSDPFVDVMYWGLRHIFGKRNQRFRLTADLPDFICDFCGDKTCFSKEYRDDRFVAAKYHFQIGGVYTSQKLRETVGF